MWSLRKRWEARMRDADGSVLRFWTGFGEVGDEGC